MSKGWMNIIGTRTELWRGLKGLECQKTNIPLHIPHYAIILILQPRIFLFIIMLKCNIFPKTRLISVSATWSRLSSCYGWQLKHNSAFCCRYLTETCVGSNSGVWSFQDNVACGSNPGEATARELQLCQHQSGKALRLDRMVNISESP